MQLTVDTPVVDDDSMTKQEFCLSEKISMSMLHKMWSLGQGPDFYYVGNRRRISREARQRWRRQREAAALLPQSTERHERQAAAGRISAAKRAEA